MRVKGIIVCALCCVVLTAGCSWLGLSRPPRPIELDVTDPPDKDVQPPAWYKPAKEHDPWPLGPAPEHATREWREWWTMRYNSRAVVRPAATAPKIDGDLSDAAWAGAAVGTPFVNADAENATPGTTAFLAYDAKNVYIGARLDEPSPATMRLEAKAGQLGVNLDDHFGVYVAPGWRASQFRVGWVLVNPNGVMNTNLDQKINGVPDVTAAARVGGKAWTVEIAIPLKRLGVTEPDDLWGAVWACQLIRGRVHKGPPELSSWSRVTDEQTGRVAWGHVIFKGVRPKEEKKPEAEAPKTEGTPEKKDEGGGSPAEADTPPATKADDAEKEKAGEHDGN